MLEGSFGSNSSPGGTLEVTGLKQERLNGIGDRIHYFLFDDAGEVRKSLLIALNNASLAGAPPPTLREGDEVTLLPPISGG